MSKQTIVMDEFPNSRLEPFELTSPATGKYNCIAWALEDPQFFYWPGPKEFYNWPKDLPRELSMEVFVQIFAANGYQICENASLEKGFQKIAIFEKNSEPTHAARQLPDGFWTSKIGALEDVRHSLAAISGGMYGGAVVFLKRENPADF